MKYTYTIQNAHPSGDTFGVEWDGATVHAVCGPLDQAEITEAIADITSAAHWEWAEPWGTPGETWATEPIAEWDPNTDDERTDVPGVQHTYHVRRTNQADPEWIDAETPGAAFMAYRKLRGLPTPTHSYPHCKQQAKGVFYCQLASTFGREGAVSLAESYIVSDRGPADED